MSATSETSSAGVVVALTPPMREGVADGGSSLCGRAACLAEQLGAETAVLTWNLADEVDLYALCRAAAGELRKRGAAVVLVADDDLGRELAPLVALELNTSAVVGCSDVVVRADDVVFVKPVQAGWLEREWVFAPGFTRVATVQLDTAAVERAEEVLVAAQPWTVAPPPVGSTEPSVRRLSLTPPDARTVDLIHARRIIGLGVGGATQELLGSVAELAELLEGSVGATRPVVDEGLLPKERLIGQTGRKVAPELYLALGISGSPHHVAGVQGAEHILAVNRDEHAPIVTFSDTTFVGLLEEVVPELVRRLRAVSEAERTAERSDG